MYHAAEHADNPTRSLEGLRRAAVAHLVCALMLLSSLVLMSDRASSDPLVIDNTDDTSSVVWDFDDPANYTLSGIEFMGGDARLRLLNQSDADDDASDWSQGTMTNLDSQAFPGSLTIDETETTYQYSVQYGAEGVDSYLLENKINDNYGSGDTLVVDSEIGRRSHIVMWFDLSTIPSEASISDAQLYLYQAFGSKGGDVVFEIRELTRHFLESEVTWSKYETASMWTSPGGDFGSYCNGRYTLTNQIGWVQMDISKLVERWIGPMVTNNGLVMVPVPASGDNQKLFQSSDDTRAPAQNPRLVVNYTVQGSIGVLESRAIGPGTNATFTLASWSNSSVSVLDDGFSGPTLSDKWAWMNDPSVLGGSYDIGLTRPGWMHVTGSSNSNMQNTSVGCNYLYQDVTGDFVAYTHVEELFTATAMSAGLLLFESPYEWVYVARADPDDIGMVTVMACDNGTSEAAASIPWAGLPTAHLKMEKNSTGVWLYASEDGADYVLVHHHSPTLRLMDTVSIGVFVSSGSTVRPVAEFDQLAVTSHADPTVEVRVRTGNSTSFSDPSWTDWEHVPVLSSPVVPGTTGKYIQYRLSMSTDHAWYVPAFSSFACWHERHEGSGTMETQDYLPTDFSMWCTMTTSETKNGGSVRYSYSTDHGDTWVNAGTGGSYAITSTQPSLRIRIQLDTYDTLTTPAAHQVEAVHAVAISHLVVTVPEEVVAGEPFPITIYVKDSTDATMIHWSGSVSLTAMAADGVHEATSDLAIESVTVTSGGQVIVPNQAYTCAETIRIKALAQGAYGLSQPVAVVSGPVSSVSVAPAISTIMERTDQALSATASDVYGNEVETAEFAWAIDSAIGSLSASTGQTVIYMSGTAGNSGSIEASCLGITDSLSITVVHETSTPYFIQSIPDQVKDEDFGSWSIDLSPYVRDTVHEIDELRWFVTNESIVDAIGENRTGNMMLALSTIPDVAGTDEIDLYVVDPDGLYAKTSFMVEIVAVNDWPVIERIDPLVVRHDILYVYNMRYHVHDVDNTEDELVLSVDTDSMPYVSAERLALYIAYPAALNGTTHAVIVTVSDGMFMVSTVVRISVTDNYVPVTVESLPDVEMFQGERYVSVLDLDDYFVDPDSEPLSYDFRSEHVVVDVSSTHEINLSAPSDWYGTEHVVFSAIDPHGARAESAMTVVVHRVNQAPTIEGVPDLIVKHDLRYEFDLTRYVSDPDDDLDDLHVTTDDPHAVPAGMVLTVLYPESFLGQELPVEITVSDGDLSDTCAIMIAVGDNAPPASSHMPSHSFYEDFPTPYPSSGSLETYFTDDEDGTDLSFQVFVLSDKVTGSVVSGSLDQPLVYFATEANWYGGTWFVVRATDSGGALAECTVELTILPCPDMPVLTFNETLEVTTGIQTALDISGYASDPDMHSQGLEFSIGGDHCAYVQMVGTVLVMEFPDAFLGANEDSRLIEIPVTVTDPDGLHDTKMLKILVVKRSLGGDESQWQLLALVAMGIVAAGSFAIAMSLRKRPFLIKDIMLVHNDGFLIGRAAEKQAGEIDEDVLSGMLTAVLNFVEDSMSGTQDGLRSFGFEHYKVLVKRGRMTYMALVYEGDAPESTEDRMGELILKVEKIYRKRIENWTGDMDTDFAGIEVLLKGFVKENGKRAKGLNGSSDGPGEKVPEPEAEASAK